MVPNSGSKNKPPVVLACSGLDPTGSAGLLADVRVISALGCHPCGVVTCETVQSSRGLISVVPIDPEIFASQLDSLIGDTKPDAVKIGAIASGAVISLIGNMIDKFPGIPVVTDPVFAPTEGPSFLADENIRKFIDEIFCQTLLATPNLKELGIAVDLDIDPADDDRILHAATRLGESGISNILVTGLQRDGKFIDRFFCFEHSDISSTMDFSHDIIPGAVVHGTGCVLSSAIAANRATGLDLTESISGAINLTTSAIKNAHQLGNGSLFWSIK